MTIHEIGTDLSSAEVIERARSFFALAGSSYAAFPAGGSASSVRLHLDVGEIVIGAIERDGATWVRGSASRGAHLLTRFLRTLAPPAGAKRTTNRYLGQRVHSASPRTFGGSAEPAPAASTLAA